MEHWLVPCLSCLAIGFVGGYIAGFLIYARKDEDGDYD
jgi:hypothetical protein